MTDPTAFQSHHNGPLKPDIAAYLDSLRIDHKWSYKALGERLNISGAFAYNILNKGMNITTDPYMVRIARGIDALKAGKLDISPAASTTATSARKYSYVLREDLEIAFTLPKNLTEKEADRLSLFIRSLPQ